MTRLEELICRLRRYGLARLSVKRLEIIRSDLRERIHSEQVFLADVDRQITDLVEQKRGITDDMWEDRKELVTHLRHLRSREDEVASILNTRRIRSPFFAR